MPKPIEIITVVAIILGPVLALFAQRVLDHLREKRQQRLRLFMTLISTRAEFLSQNHVRALNTIVVVFNRRSDQKIREAWRRVLEHAATPTTNLGWTDRYFDLKVDLFQAMAVAVEYEFTADDLKRQVYSPVGHGQAEQELATIRQTLVKLLTDDGLKVKIVEAPRSTAPHA